jgi:nucleotide-binding universal stress UspA family protein
MMFEHLLIPLDGSSLAECVLPHGLAIAKVLGARVTLLQVVESTEASDGTRAIDLLEWHYGEAQARAYLDAVAERLSRAGQPAGRVLLQGDPAERVIDHARAENTGLIVLSSHGRSGLSGWNVSSVVQKILARAYTSILLIPAYHPATVEIAGLRYQRLLVPLDGSQRAECVLPLVAAIASQHGSLVLLAHVVRKPELPRRAPPSHEDLELANALTERNRIEATRDLEELRTRLPHPAEVRMFVEDHVAITLQQLAQEEKVDLVVLSAHGYSGGTRWPYGSLASSFIMYGTTPLLIVQDLPRQAIEPSAAELAAREHGSH